MDEHIIYIPGLRLTQQSHWIHSWMSELDSFSIVKYTDQNALRRSSSVKALENEVFRHRNKRIILVAHDVGCHVVAHWASISKKAIGGALLVAPPDIRQYELNGYTKGFWPHATAKLLFPTILAASNNDVSCSLSMARSYGLLWGATLVNVGPKGHIDSADRDGRWTEGIRLLNELSTVPSLREPILTVA